MTDYYNLSAEPKQFQALTAYTVEEAAKIANQGVLLGGRL